MQSPGSVFKNFIVPKSVNLKDQRFVQRLQKLQEYLMDHCTIEELPNGWRCTPKAANQPSYIVTPDSVMFIMKNLGF